MPYFVIVGKLNCPNFAHVAYLARYLSDHLQDFYVKIVQKDQLEWGRWLEKKMIMYKWNLTVSPIIYRQLIYRGGPPHLIGGISEFWQYCYDYYNIESLLSQSEIMQLVEDNKMYFPNKDDKEEPKSHICIFGVSSRMLYLLLLELYGNKDEYFGNSTEIKLFDINMDYDTVYEHLNEIADDLNFNLGIRVDIVTTLEEALKNCQLLIIIDELSQRVDEVLEQWRLRNVIYMHILVDYLNKYANKNLRVILGHYGPVCFNATLLKESCTTINPNNIVAVTSDLGLAAISIVSQKSNIRVENLGAPIVWGYIGLNEYIDVGSIIKKCDVYLPNTRAIRTNGGSTLPLGIIKTELRLMNYITDDYDGIQDDINQLRAKVNDFERLPVYSKARAIISLIKLWYAKKSNDAIISLGICSNGSFNIKSGIVFSQPAILKNDIWIPYNEFPLSEVTKLKVKELSDDADEFMKKYLVKKSPTDKEYVYV